MKLILIIVVFVLFVPTVHADYFYKRVGYECDTKNDAVILSYAGASNEAGRKMMKKKGPRQWEPWSLVVKDKKKRDYIGSHKTVHGQCTLSDGVYTITIGPLPGNANLQGKCGGFMSAWAEVKRDADAVLPRHEFEFGDCHVTMPVTTKIVIKAGGGAPVIHKVSWEDFYPPNNARD